MRTESSLLQRFAQSRPLTWLLAGFCSWALLLWIGALFGMGGRVAPVEPLPASALPQPGPATPDRIGPLIRYAEAAARPLFTQDRRPRGFLASVPEGEGEAAQSASLDFILTGVLISPQVRLAILQPTAGGNSQRVRVGNSPEGAGGWRLIDVQPRRAVFEGGGGQSTLDLRTFGAPGMPPQAVSANADAAAAARAAADAAQGAADAAAAGPPLPPPTPAEQARIEELRKRIEARRAQLRATQTQPGTAAPSSAPVTRTQ